MHDCLFDSSLTNHKLSYIRKYISVTYALDSVHEKIDVWTEGPSFAVLSDKPSRIESYSRPEYKSAEPNWFIRRTFHVLNSNIMFGTWKVRRLNRASLIFDRFLESWVWDACDLKKLVANSTSGSQNVAVLLNQEQTVHWLNTITLIFFVAN